ncbi:hypothetical protein LX32DRAFT_280488 [Colletotrichum zoysiae]|uniref:Uncharacterized protein n=1 Tax=Colletotrichum zoysiae TaxID=1216348 RepID=A0AAD9M728_9PEZI|nr:hypothetical protein LX32DRAFT_280488 [Colletotrichum zoysiae]
MFRPSKTFACHGRPCLRPSFEQQPRQPHWLIPCRARRHLVFFKFRRTGSPSGGSSFFLFLFFSKSFPTRSPASDLLSYRHHRSASLAETCPCDRLASHFQLYLVDRWESHQARWTVIGLQQCSDQILVLPDFKMESQYIGRHVSARSRLKLTQKHLIITRLTSSSHIVITS